MKTLFRATLAGVLFLAGAGNALATSVPASIVTNPGPGEWNDPGALCTAIQDYWKWHSTQPGATSCGTVDIVSGCPAWPNVNASRTVRPWFKNGSGQCVVLRCPLL